ncbi:MAG TPA: hypothetical protein VFL27_15720 [Candidatus Dormibacteraeota bacterium]|nr:hypothetical protein [Candidatus Dormibacteraeota bacterium]
MSQRVLLAIGVVAIASSVVIGAAVFGTGNGFLGARSISIDQAQQSVQSFLQQTGDQDLQIDELMEFQDNFYALIMERSTGIGAFELLVRKSDGWVGFEPGPNMMWNTKYSAMGNGMMGPGMMGGGPFRTGSANPTMTVSAERATQIAQAWLDRNLSGDVAGTPDAFYGYFTFHFEKAGKIAGMLSVNGFTGQVWFHTWHGAFVQARDFGK